MTAVLRHVKGLPLLRLLPPLRHAVTSSVAANPVLLAFDPYLARPMTALPTFTSWYGLQLTVGPFFTPVRHRPSAPDVGCWLLPL